MKMTMKASVVAAIAAGVTLAAQAQSSVSINGYVDGSLVLEKGGPAGTVKKVSSGVSGPTRLVFRGIEDLGGGLNAFFHLEAGVLFDTGGSLQQNFFGRQAFVGISGGAGKLQLGLVYVPLFTTLRDVVDPFRNSYAGMAGNIMTAGFPAGPKSVAFPNPSAVTGTVSSGAISRANTALYTTPKFAGFDGELAYSFGEQGAGSVALRTMGAAAGYANGPFTARAAYEKTWNAAASDAARNAIVGANYDFGPVKAYLGYAKNKGFGTADSNDALVGVSVPFGVTTVLASYVRKDDRSPANNDANQIGLAGVYFLSKRTTLHVSTARISNTLPNTSPGFYPVSYPSGLGSGNKALTLGMGHFF